MNKNSVTKDKECISVILPAYNEAGNIDVLLEKAHNAFLAMGLDGEIILVNDGSTDNTGTIARECMKKYSYLKVHDHQKNLGLTKALTTGFKKASGDKIVFLCSDLQSDPEEDIPKLLNGFKMGADLVVGWRQGRKESKRFGSKIYNFISRLLFGVKVHDQNWIKAFNKNLVQSLLLRSDWHRFLVAIAIHKGYKVVEVKTNWYPRVYGKSKYGFLRIPKAILDMFVLKIEMKFVENPMRFFGTMGIVAGFVGFSILAVLFALHHVFDITFSEFTRLKYVLISTLLILLGAGLFSLGLLGEFMVSYLEKILSKKNNKD